jgi:hypothetical protein
VETDHGVVPTVADEFEGAAERSVVGYVSIEKEQLGETSGVEPFVNRDDGVGDERRSKGKRAGPVVAVAKGAAVRKSGENWDAGAGRDFTGQPFGGDCIHAGGEVGSMLFGGTDGEYGQVHATITECGDFRPGEFGP